MLNADLSLKWWCVEPDLSVFGYLLKDGSCEWRLYGGVEVA